MKWLDLGETLQDLAKSNLTRQDWHAMYDDRYSSATIRCPRWVSEFLTSIDISIPQTIYIALVDSAGVPILQDLEIA